VFQVEMHHIFAVSLTFQAVLMMDEKVEYTTTSRFVLSVLFMY